MLRKVGLLALAGALSAAAVTHAAVVNGDYETGNLTGWTTIGATHADTAAMGATPTQGTYQAYIDNTGNFASPAGPVATMLGVTGPTILALGQGTPTTGSAIAQDITVAAGDVLTFDWNWLTDEWNEAATFNDFAIFTVDSSAYFLASRGSTHATLNLTTPPPGFDGQTNWATASHTFASGGTFKLGFAVFNVGDAGHNSVLLVDAVAVSVPEPATFALLALGVAGMLRRR
jgi:hypothetical protein